MDFRRMFARRSKASPRTESQESQPWPASSSLSAPPPPHRDCQDQLSTWPLVGELASGSPSTAPSVSPRISRHRGQERSLDNIPQQKLEQASRIAVNVATNDGLIEIQTFQEVTGQKTRVDVVAIHGLNGHPLKTWTENDVIWFSDLLPKQLPDFDLRVCTFGYNSKVLFSGTVFQVRDFGMQLLSSLDLKRKKTSTENVPIIFICHSLGGVVFKKMLIMAHERESIYNDIQTSTKSVIFFSTPHGGSDLASLSRVLRNIFDVCTMGSVRADLLKNLERRSAELAEIAEQFVERASQLKIVTVYEGRPLKPAPASFPVVVDKSSAVLNLVNERVVPVDVDHRAICRFSDAEDPRFQFVLFAVSNAIKESIALEDNKLRDPHADTFLWIWDHPKYQTWEKGRASSLLWVQGKPGSGKSTLANFVRARVADRVDHRVNHSSIAVDFFYSARGGSLQNGHYWMLRSILYQFLLKAPGLWGSFLNDFMECRQIEQSDEWQGRSKASATGGLLEQLWSFNRMKALFGQLGSIHAPALELTAYVIIDALDESEELDRQEVIQMFRKVSMCHPSWPIAFKIFLTSRPSPRIEQVLRRCPTIVLENETQKDIVNYVNSETARIATNVLDCKHEELAFVSSYLIQWAQGVFLWVRLVLIELDERATEGFCSVVELEELLLSIPKDLRQLYERILTKIKKGLIRTTQECQTVLRWVAYSPRPLLIEEMVEVIATSACAGLRISAIELKRRRVGNAEDLRRRLISLCGNLVEVKGGIVQFIHTSVREFLLESVCDKGMSLVRADSLFEIASSCADYVDGFHDLLQYKAPLYASEERSIGENESYHDFSTYVQFIDELRLLRYIFGCGEAYLTSLDRELAKGSVNRSLRGTMSSACTTMQPAVIEAILAGEVRILDRLILYPDQINAIYSVPLEDPRLNNLFVKSIATNTDAYHITIMQMLSFLHTPGMLDILDLLHKRGADPNTQDELGRTSLHAAVQVGARAYRFLSQILNERSMPTIKDGFIDPHTRFLKACLHSGDSLLKAMINAMSLPCILLSSVLKYSAGVQLKDSDGENITLCTLMQYITQLGDKSAWAIAWTLKSAHAKLSRLLINNVTLITKVIREPLERFSHIFWRIANESGDEELKAASYALNHIRSFISRLLDHGADPTIRETASQNSPLDLALQSGDREIIFMLLNSFKERTEFKISIAKTKSEKSEILRGAGDLLARLVYHECSELSSDNIVNWIFDEFYNDRNFIFGNRSIKLWEMYVDQEGCTAMHIAAKKGQSRALTKMVNIGFPKDGLDGLGRTPMDIAKLNHRLTAVSSLMDNKKRQEHRVIWSWDDVGWRLIKKGDTV